MSTPLCGFRAIDGSIWPMLPDCKRRNAEIYTGRRPANFERGVTKISVMPPDMINVNDYYTSQPIRKFWLTEDEIIAADIAAGEPVKRIGFWSWIAIGAVMSLGAVAGAVAAHIWSLQ